MYDAVAHAVPILLLGLAFESKSLERIKLRTRKTEERVKIFKSSVVMLIVITMCVAGAVAETLSLLVLNNSIRDSGSIQATVLSCTFALLAILLGRILIDGRGATRLDRLEQPHVDDAQRSDVASRIETLAAEGTRSAWEAVIAAARASIVAADAVQRAGSDRAHGS
jgi:hypothetical protein